MKRQSLLTRMLLLFALIVGSSTMWGQERTFTLVTSANDLEADANYLIADGTDGSCTVLGGRNSSSNRKAVTASSDNGTITLTDIATSASDTDKPHIISLKASSTNWTLYDVAEAQYLNGGSKTNNNKNNNHLKPADEPETGTGAGIANGVYTITINTTTYVATITNQNSYFVQKNSQSAIYATYYSGQNDVYLYKEVDTTPTAPLESITLSGDYPTSFRQNDAFSHEGMTVTATYGTGEGATTKDVTSSATFTGYDMSTVGSQTVTVSYTEGTGNDAITKTAEYGIEVTTPPTLSSIALSGTYPTTFLVGDEFSHEGMTVTATFNDNSTEDVTAAATFTGYDMSQTGEQTVTVTYTYNNVSATQTYTITVNEIPTKTIAQFIAAGGGKCYLTGTVSNIQSTTYGNFNLTDASGTIYVFGCLTPQGASGQFSTLGINEGSKIKVLANTYALYNNSTHEAVDVTFVEKYIHTLTVSATNGSIDIEGKTAGEGGTYTIDEDYEVTATATSAEHYLFTSWTADGVTLTDNTANPLTFTMPTNNVTLTANFSEIPKHTATFYVQGSEIGNDEDVYEGDAITFPSTVDTPAGYTFMGWTTATISNEQNTAPATLVNSANMGNADITYHAVFAIGDVKPAVFDHYEKVTTEQTDWSGTYLLGATYTGGTNEDNKGTFVYSAPASSGKYGDRVALTPGTTEYTDYEIVIAASTNGYTIYHNKSKKYFAYNDNNTSNELNFADAVTTSNQEWSITGVAVIKNAAVTSRLLSYNGSSPRFACYTNTNQTATDLYKRIETGGTTYASYCTTVPTTGTITLNAACKDGSTIYGTYYTNRTYVMPENMVGQVVSVDNNGKLVVQDAYEENDVVPACTALLLYTIDEFTGTKNYTINYSNEEGVDWSADNMLKGAQTADEETVGDNCLFYRLTMHNGTSIGFWWGAEDGAAFKPGANKAYLAVPQEVASRGFSFADDVTAISEELRVKDEAFATAPVYNLNGQRVDHLTKGLYIVNGKKVVIK